MYEGTVKSLVLGRGFGFIAVPDQPDVFFHATDVDDALPFDETLQERRVRFAIQTTAKGLRAICVQAN